MTDLSEVRTNILVALRDKEASQRIKASDLHAFFRSSNITPIWSLENVREAVHQLVWTDQIDITEEGYLSLRT